MVLIAAGHDKFDMSLSELVVTGEETRAVILLFVIQKGAIHINSNHLNRGHQNSLASKRSGLTVRIAW
jgi:hypothetical protein